MLVLSRKKNEQIRIGHDITITVIEIRNDRVRIGIEAPPEIDVHRDEVYLRIHRPITQDYDEPTDESVFTEE